MIKSVVCALALAGVLSACGPYTPGDPAQGRPTLGFVNAPSSGISSATMTQGGATTVAVVPASSHVTGVYPAVCTRTPADDPRLPVRRCTPGAIRSDVDPNHLERNVCLANWSASVRPPSAETDRLKTQAMRAYGVPTIQRSVTELDHLIPESLGGASDAANLWPEVSDEPGHGFNNSKDAVEVAVRHAVCARRDAGYYRQAVAAFATNWTTAEQTLGITPVGGKHR